MSYLPVRQSLGDVSAAVEPTVEEQERYVRYELPRQQLELDRKRFEFDKRMAKWDITTAIATGVIPILAVLGIIGADRARRP